MGDLFVEVLPALGQGIYPTDLGPRKPAVENFRDRAAEVTQTIGEVSQYLKENIDLAWENGHGSAPNQVEIGFGLDLQAETNAVIIKATAGCTFTVRLTWNRDPDQP